jgi:hypothetical protein
MVSSRLAAAMIMKVIHTLEVYACFRDVGSQLTQFGPSILVPLGRFSTRLRDPEIDHRSAFKKRIEG